VRIIKNTNIRSVLEDSSVVFEEESKGERTVNKGNVASTNSIYPNLILLVYSGKTFKLREVMGGSYDERTTD